MTIVDYAGIRMKNCNRVKHEHDEAFLIENNSQNMSTSFLIRHKLNSSGNASRLTPQMGLGLCLALGNDSPVVFLFVSASSLHLLCLVFIIFISHRLWNLCYYRNSREFCHFHSIATTMSKCFCSLCHVSAKCLAGKSGCQHTA